MIVAAPAPPGAPIGDAGQDWLGAPPWYRLDDAVNTRWLNSGPPF
jgi:hypothetical protein